MLCHLDPEDDTEMSDGVIRNPEDDTEMRAGVIRNPEENTEMSAGGMILMEVSDNLYS